MWSEQCFLDLLEHLVTLTLRWFLLSVGKQGDGLGVALSCLASESLVCIDHLAEVLRNKSETVDFGTWVFSEVGALECCEDAKEDWLGQRHTDGSAFYHYKLC